MFGPDHKGAFMTEKVTEKVAQNCDRNFCVCTSHPGYSDTIEERVNNARDQTVKPTEADQSGPSIASMGVTTGSNSESDTFNPEDFDGIVTIDRYDLYIQCKFGPDSQGNYQESILSMFDYEMLCKN